MMCLVYSCCKARNQMYNKDCKISICSCPLLLAVVGLIIDILLAASSQHQTQGIGGAKCKVSPHN